MSSSAKNWDIQCAYQFVPYAHWGENHVIELDSMQLSYSTRKGGFMHSAISPLDSFSIGVVLECKGVATFDCTKLSKGDIVFFDDAKAYKFMSKDEIKVAIISISNTRLTHLKPILIQAIGYYMKDINEIVITKLQSILDEYTNTTSLQLQKTEDEILSMLITLFNTQTPLKAKLTKGETTVFEILEKIYGHMDGEISIKSLAKEYSLSEHTLQKSFKTLFGFTPKHFLSLLKLNHVHHDLKYADKASSSVSLIAQKWGFKHMGRFSAYYSELFEEKPSVTLKREYFFEENMINKCASRQDEIVLYT